MNLLQQVNLNSSETYKNWVKNPVPIFFQIWMWNLTNREEVQEGTEKPSIVQRGPYTYRLVQTIRPPDKECLHL